MADLMKFDLVSPERKLVSTQVSMATIPGSEGDFAAMANHAPIVASLRPGILRLVAEKGDITEYVVSGGFVEISESGASVLAEHALPKAEATKEFFDHAVAHAEGAVARAGDDAVAKALAEKALNDVRFLQGQLGN